MRYHSRTHISPEEVIEGARRFFAEYTRMSVAEESPDSIVFTGEIGLAKLRVDREHGHTNVHAETDRVVGLDVTDIVKRFLYTLHPV